MNSAQSKLFEKLTSLQKQFCLAYLDNGNASHAYRVACEKIGKKIPKGVSASASRMLTNANVSIFIDSIRNDVSQPPENKLNNNANRVVASRDEKRLMLANIVQIRINACKEAKGKMSMADAVSAIAELNRMDNEYENKVIDNQSTKKTFRITVVK